MKTCIRSFRAILAIVVLMAFAMPTFAVVPPGLTITDGTNTVIIDQGGNVTFSPGCVGCSTSIVSAQPGNLAWGGTIGAFSVPLIVGQSKPLLGPAPDMDLGIQSVKTTSGGTLTISLSDVGFTTPDISSVSMMAGGLVSGGGTVTFLSYVDNSNAAFGQGTAVGTLGPFSDSNFHGALAAGSPPTAAPFSMTESVTLSFPGAGNGGGDFGMQALPSALKLACPTSTGTVGTPYSSTLHASGGIPGYTFAIISGVLPGGLTLDANSGAITGTPTAPAGAFPFIAQVTDSVGTTADTSALNCSIVTSSQLFQISGYTYKDNNANMVYDNPPDIPIPGVTVTLTDCSNNVLNSMVTDATGFYDFTGLAAGCYLVKAPSTAISGTLTVNLETAAALTVTLGPDSSNNNFGYIPPGSISGYTYSDIDNNQMYDNPPDTPIGSVTVTLTDCSGNPVPGQSPISTDGTGYYIFTGLTAGCYQVHAPGTANGETADTPGTIQVILPLGGQSTNNNFGYVYPAINANCVVINAIQGVAITPVTMTASGGTGTGYTFSASGLPTGLTMSTGGTISGTPTVSGTFSYTVTVKDSAGNTGTLNCSVTVNGPPAATCISITAVQNVAITPVTLTGSGGVGGPYTFSATGLPSGLTISSGGTISGTPTVSGPFNYTVTVKDSAGNTGTLNCSVTVNGPPAATCISITAVQNVAITPVTLTGSGGTGTGYTFTATGLPSGLSISSSGTISGTPTVSGPFNYTVTVKDSAGNTGTLNCSVTVNGPPAATCISITAVQNVAITPVTLTGSGGAGGPYTFSATGLPSGLTISSGGTISGTPTVSGPFNYTVTVKDSAGNTGTLNCSVTVNGPPAATCVSITAVQNVAITPVTLTGSGGVGGPYTFSATGLPTGLTMSTGGTISGTPTVSGPFNYTVTVKDSAGNTGTLNCSVTVSLPPTATCVSISAIQGVAITPVTMTGSGGAGGPYTFSATGLPAGLTISSGGTISGTPTVSGTFSYTVTVTDKAGTRER